MKRILLICLILLSGCSVVQPNINWDCTENSYLSYNHIVNPVDEYRLVVGVRVEVYGNDISRCPHAWLEYKPIGSDKWKVYDPSLTSRVYGMIIKYESYLVGDEALRLITAEQRYHAAGYDSILMSTELLNGAGGELIGYMFYVIHRETKDSAWVMVHGETIYSFK